MILAACAAAPNPLSMLTTTRPGLHEASMLAAAARPPAATPYPTLVGTPITGALTSPATTLGRAPSIPATTTTHSAARSCSSRASSRPSPATPTSARTSARTPSTASVAAHSLATFRSVVPAVTTSTLPRAVGSTPTATVPATGSAWTASPGKRAAAWSRTPAAQRVARAGASGSRARNSASSAKICSGVLPSPNTTSGTPVRRRRSTSSTANSPSGTPAAQGSVPASAGTADRRDIEVQRTGPQRPLVDLRVLIASGPDAGQHRRMLGRVRRPGQVRRAELHPAEIAEMPHPQFAVAALLQAQLGPVYLRQHIGADRGAVRQPRGQAGRRGFVRTRNPQVVRQRPHLVLPHRRFQQGMPDTVLGRRAQPGPPVTGVVGVGAGQHGGESAAPGQRGQPIVQLGFAVVAAEAVVAPVVVALQLGRADQLVPDAHGPGHRPGAVQLAGREGRRDGGDGEGSFPERPDGQRSDQRGVHPAGERDQGAAQSGQTLGQLASQRGKLVRHAVPFHVARARAAVICSGVGPPWSSTWPARRIHTESGPGNSQPSRSPRTSDAWRAIAHRRFTHRQAANPIPNRPPVVPQPI